MRMMRWFVPMLVMLGLAACAGEPAMPASDAEVTGTITDFRQSGTPDHPLQMVVTGTEPEPRDRAVVYLRRGTEVSIAEEGGRVRRGSVDDLRQGDRVQVWTTGVELRSYPVQVFAVRVHVLR